MSVVAYAGAATGKKVIECVNSLTSKPDFPAFSDQIQKILAAAGNDEASIRELTNLIIRDYGLTDRAQAPADSRQTHEGQGAL